MTPTARAVYDVDQALFPWHSYWMDLPNSGYTPSMFNSLLEWLGVSGCKYTKVLHANAPTCDGKGGVPCHSGFNNTNVTDLGLLEGTCRMHA